MKQLLGIGSATSSDAAILAEILMNNRDLPPLCIDVCYDLATSAWRLMRVLRAWMTIAIENLEEFSGFHALPIAPFVEKAS